MSELNIKWVSTGKHHMVGTCWHVRVDIHDVPDGRFQWELSNDKTGVVYFKGYEPTLNRALSTATQNLNVKMGKMA